jgi:hypothetical protein
MYRVIDNHPKTEMLRKHDPSPFVEKGRRACYRPVRHAAKFRRQGPIKKRPEST